MQTLALNITRLHKGRNMIFSRSSLFLFLTKIFKKLVYNLQKSYFIYLSSFYISTDFVDNDGFSVIKLCH